MRIVCLNKVSKETINIRSLVHIFSDRQPGEPDWQDLVQVDLASVVLEDLGDCTDGVLCGVDVLGLSGVWLVDQVTEERNTLSSCSCHHLTTTQSQHSTP